MMKLLYLPTKIVFTLPDEEALRIKKDDRGGNYKILDVGYIETEEPKTIEEKTIKELLLNEEKEEGVKDENIKPKINLSKMSKPELIEFAKKCNLKVDKKDTADKLREMIKSTGIV